MFQDILGMSLTKSSRHQATSSFRDIPGYSWYVPHKILQTQKITSSFRDIPEHSWYVPHKILQTPSHSSLRDVPGLSWDVPHEILWTPSHTSPDIPFGLDCRRYLIMSGQCWNMSDICRRHWTSLITIAIIKVLL